MNEVIIYALHTSLIKDKRLFVMSFIDEKRREKAEKFINEKDQLLSLGAGYLLRRYLPKGEIKITDSGKPYLEDGPFFNISHSDEYVVLAVHPSRDVGVDIERINEKRLDGIQYVLLEEEKNVIDINDLFRIWSNKESIIKCLSTGLKDIKKVKGLPLEGEGQDYYTKSMIYDGYSLSVTLKGNEPFDIKINRVTALEEQ